MYDIYKDSYNESPTPESFYKSIGGPLGDWAEEHPENFQNTCAARLSKALNYGGFEIPRGTSGTYLGEDGKSYFIQAKAMSEYLSKSNVWGSPQLLKNGNVLKNGVFFKLDFRVEFQGTWILCIEEMRLINFIIQLLIIGINNENLYKTIFSLNICCGCLCREHSLHE